MQIETGTVSGVLMDRSQHLRIKKILPEAHELSGDILLTVYFGWSTWCVWRETCSDRLIHPYHVGEVCPRVWVLDRRICSRLPAEWTVFL